MHAPRHSLAIVSGYKSNHCLSHDLSHNPVQNFGDSKERALSDNSSFNSTPINCCHPIASVRSGSMFKLSTERSRVNNKPKNENVGEVGKNYTLHFSRVKFFTRAIRNRVRGNNLEPQYNSKTPGKKIKLSGSDPACSASSRPKGEGSLPPAGTEIMPAFFPG